MSEQGIEPAEIIYDIQAGMEEKPRQEKGTKLWIGPENWIDYEAPVQVSLSICELGKDRDE